MRAALLLAAIISCGQIGPAAANERQPRAVLILDEADPSDGIPTTFSTTLRRVLIEARPHVAVYAETLDFTRFSREEQGAVLRSYLREKYHGVQFGAIVALARDGEARARRDSVSAAQRRHAALTERERVVFDGVVAGRLNKQIATELGITEATVKAHRAQVMAKMSADSLAELVQSADLLRAAGCLRSRSGPPGVSDVGVPRRPPPTKV